MKQVLAIVVTRDPKDCTETVKSLMNQTLKPQKLIVAVGKPDWKKSTGQIVGETINEALRPINLQKYDWLLKSDDDIIYPPDFLEINTNTDYDLMGRGAGLLIRVKPYLEYIGNWNESDLEDSYPYYVFDVKGLQTLISKWVNPATLLKPSRDTLGLKRNFEAGRDTYRMGTPVDIYLLDKIRGLELTRIIGFLYGHLAQLPKFPIAPEWKRYIRLRRGLTLPAALILYLKKKEMRARVSYKLKHGVPRWVDYPTTLQLDTHNYCNLECIYCNPQGAFEIPYGQMSLDMIEYILHYFYDRGINVDVVAPFMNGDGLLEERLPEICAMAKMYQPKARVTVFTNGVAYPNRRLLVDRNIDEVRFTISAVTREKYRFIHGKDKLQDALKTLEWVTKNKYPNQHIILNYILTGYNTDELSAWKEKFSDYEHDIRPLHYGLHRKASRELQDEMGIPWHDAVRLSQKDQLIAGKLSEDRPCPCWHDLAVTWDGNIIQCPDVSPTNCVIGKIGVDDILTVWRKRFQGGMNYPACQACNQRMPYWRSIFEKYSNIPLRRRVKEAIKGHY